MKRLFTVTGATLGLLIAGAGFGSTDAEPLTIKKRSKSYIVQMAGNPLAGYDGRIAGMSATKPEKGAKLDMKTSAAKQYAAHLEARHDDVLSAVGGRKIYDYHVVFNGFAAALTDAQVEALKARPDVVNVWEDELLKPQTQSTPTFLGLTEPGSPWRFGFTGEDIVVASIDTGIWPEHPSVADTQTPRLGDRGPRIPYDAPPASFTGEGCDFGNTSANPDDAAFDCNDKLLKAEAFNETFSLFSEFADGEFLSARDSDGHGTHTATTAAGNYGPEAVIDGESFGTVSGMAPRARVATYKVCWEAPDPNDSGCFSSDSMAAIDQAVADGADVINFSIGGSGTTFSGADDIAFLFAQDAGVFVAVSAGNSGPFMATIGTPSGVPWVTATAALEDDENFGTGLIVESPASIAAVYEGLEGAGDVSLEDSGAITADVVPAEPIETCGPLSNGGEMSGNIALVRRGTCSFIDKYNNAEAAGAQAIVVYNDGTAPDRIDPIVMSAPGAMIPGIMIGFFDGMLVMETAETETVVGTLTPDLMVPRVDRITGFSSRGPNAGAPDIIKPDVAAPGIGIIAGETPAPNVNASGGQLFQFLSGTSMASPHVAGVFALLKQAHPDWSAAIAKSALMTTARQNLRVTFGDDAATPFDIGAGLIDPDQALTPGLAYDVGLFEYVAFLCGAEEDLTQPAIFTPESCDFVRDLGLPFDASDLNLPSIAVAELVGSQTVTRTVTRVAGGGFEYFASFEAPPGIDMRVSPTRVHLAPGESATYEITFTTTEEAEFGQFAFGSLTWTGADGTTVRSPIAVQPVRLDAPEELRAEGTSGELSFEVDFGYNGPYEIDVDGLVAGTMQMNTIADEAESDPHFFGVPPGTTVARFSMFDEDIGDGDGSDDFDIFVFGPGWQGFPFLGSSAGPTSEEEVNIVDPLPGTYAVIVVDFATDAGPTKYKIFNFDVTDEDEGNLTVTAPDTVAASTTETVTVEWSGLRPGTRHLGALNHTDGTEVIDQTELLIDTQ
ncbi:hypothetical protein BH24PSE2_BH24PSE2_19780 [soil metagenome]